MLYPQLRQQVLARDPLAPERGQRCEVDEKDLTEQRLRQIRYCRDPRRRGEVRSKDLGGLKAPLQPVFAAALAEVASDAGLSATGQTSWTFGIVEESVVQRRAGHEVGSWPVLLQISELLIFHAGPIGKPAAKIVAGAITDSIGPSAELRASIS